MWRVTDHEQPVLRDRPLLSGKRQRTSGDRGAVGSDDVVFDDEGVKVIVDEKSLELIDGTEVDFVKEGLNEAFKFRNPNVKGECGCGESFSV
jgi:iron-sulfur cluster assembly accessory protein